MTETKAGIRLRLSCQDRRGIVAAVSGFLSDHGFSIHESQQFGDDETERFFMRVDTRAEAPFNIVNVRAAFLELSKAFNMEFEIVDRCLRPRLLVMASKQEHCLADLLYRQRTGSLSGEVVAISSNHTTLQHLATWHDIPFHHIPISSDSKVAAETELRRLIASYEIDTIVLARYMQILSAEFCQDFEGRVINIHHSLLPSFKGARPYYQAYSRGVKVIGATAHYVTGDLDEGPIICQELTSVTHAFSAEALTTIGRDQEALALSKAVSAHSEGRVLLNGQKTVVFN